MLWNNFCQYGISFDNNTARNVIIFVVDDSSSSHADNRKNNFLVLGKRPAFGIKESFCLPKKRLALVLVKQTQNVA